MKNKDIEEIYIYMYIYNTKKEYTQYFFMEMLIIFIHVYSKDFWNYS